MMKKSAARQFESLKADNFSGASTLRSAVMDASSIDWGLLAADSTVRSDPLHIPFQDEIKLVGSGVSGIAFPQVHDFSGVQALSGAGVASSAVGWLSSAAPSDVIHLLPQDVLHPASGSTAAASSPQDNGTPNMTAAVGATGDARIDGILAGVKWLGPITYSDADSPTDYQPGYFSDGNGNMISAQNEAFSLLTPQQMKALHSALSQTIFTQDAAAAAFSVGGFTNLTVTYAGPGNANATIRAANSGDPATAYAYYPDNGIYGGDIFFGNTYDATIYSMKTPVAGNYAWHTVIHELGHSLGLKHGQETGGPANVALPTEYDSLEFTVMTYRSYVGAPTTGYTYEQWGAPQTYMMLDIAALQTMYGADYSVNSGNTTYTWNPGTGNTLIDGQLAIVPGANRIFATIWDGGGTDTYDLSAYMTGVSIDLNPGGYSLFSAVQQAYLGDGHYARGNIFNALTFGGSNASLIENAIGGAGNDQIVGNAVDNVLTGNGGNDTIYGNDGADTISGGDGNDQLIGGAGNDVFDGGGGVDLIYGEGGDDTFKIFNGWVGGYGEVFIGGAGIDTFDISGVVGFTSTTVNLTDGTFAYLPGGSAPISLSSVENVIGSDASDSITGSGEVNSVIGNAGADFLYGLGGNDTLSGGAGADTLDGGDGNDTLDGGADTDTLTYASASAAVTVSLVVGAAQATGGAGTDTIANFENLTGSAFADTLTGDANANVINGGDGNDTIQGGDGNDTLVGGFGEDYVSYAAAGAGVTVNLGQISAQNTGGGGTDTISGFENVIGSAFNDTFQGTASQNRFNGGNGLDTVSFVAASGAITVNLGITGFQNTGAGGTDQLLGIENITGSGFGDTITGSNTTANTLNGAGGNDLIYGLDGADTLIGGAGDDMLDGGSGTDTANYSTNASAVTVDLSILMAQNTIGAGIDTLAAIENLTGTAFNDTLTGDAGANLVVGGLGDDTIEGGAGNDTLQGGTGVDTVSYAHAAAAVTVNLGTSLVQNTGGAGSDILSGFENVVGSVFNDTILANVSDNRLDGGDGIDTVSYLMTGAGVTVSLAIPMPQATVSSGTDTLLNVENLTGSNFVDTLTGNDGNNVLNGLSGKDTLIGGLGNDTLIGGNGINTMTGGVGADGFRFDINEFSANRDEITDFEHGIDHVEIVRSAFGAFGASAAGAINPLAFILGTAATTADQHLIYDQATGNLFYDADGVGGGAQVQIALLSTKPVMDAGDFVLV